MFTIEIQGTKKVIENINRIENVIKSNDLKVYIAKKIIKAIDRLADERLSHDDNYKKSNKYIIESDKIIIYNDVSNENGQHYSLILEYGSGIWAEKEHIGKTQSFSASGFMYWYVPEEKAPELSEYPYERIETENGVLYKVYGQTPKYIYEDAAMLVERNISRWINEYMKKELGGKL